jgi:hypothetical protein
MATTNTLITSPAKSSTLSNRLLGSRLATFTGETNRHGIDILQHIRGLLKSWAGITSTATRPCSSLQPPLLLLILLHHLIPFLLLIITRLL